MTSFPSSSQSLINPPPPPPPISININLKSSSSASSSMIIGSSNQQSTTTHSNLSPPSNLSSSANYRPLNVRDALSYLDQVKLQFQNSPGVYNKFLDIMKDFKTQMIHTPGVIDGVSSLFRGHPNLIQGFNTFLPPGYRIDVSQSETTNQSSISSPYTLITVTHPMGIQTQKRVPTQSEGEEIGSHILPDFVPITSSNSNLNSINSSQNENINPQNDLNQSKLNSPNQLSPTSISNVPSINPTKPKSINSNSNHNQITSPIPQSNQSNLDSSKPVVKPLEFNHAITYVNKIKNRYASDPKTYQTFLDILQTYQRDARPIQEVYEQVNQLFCEAPDLLAEFMQFLPDTSNSVIQPQMAIQTGTNLLTTLSATSTNSQDPPQVNHSTSTQTPSTPSLKRNFKDPHYLQHETNTSSSLPPPNKKRRQISSSHSINNPSTSSQKNPSNKNPINQTSSSELGNGRILDLNGDANPVTHVTHLSSNSPTRATKRKHRANNKTQESTNPSLNTTGLPPPGFQPPGYSTMGEAYHTALTTNQAINSAKLKSRDSGRQVGHSDWDFNQTIHSQAIPRQSPAQEELTFFHRLKTYFEDQTTYIEFLKLINLFTQDIIDLETLVFRAKPFLINCPELFTRFTDLVGWKETNGISKSKNLTNGHLLTKKNRLNIEPTTRPVLSERESTPECGPSYRYLPDSELSSTCSGRDALCWDVLNDKLVCSPIGTVEEQTFFPRQTNAFEKALYQAEDERHEYDYHIEANVRTIALLEPINLRIQQMDPETRNEYRLKPGLGGQSKSVYQRIIKKIYGKEGQEVIQALHENPALAVPIVLARLKQKDEEWKKALRDWNRVWKDVDAKNYWKALDHQGISFKAIDKKMIGNKNLINEIELIKREQQQKRNLLLNPSIIKYLPRHQLELELECWDVFYDVLKVLIHFLDYVPISTGLDDSQKDRIEEFLKSLLVSFFNIPIEELERHLTPLPPEKKGLDGANSNGGKNIEADGNETVYSEGDISDTGTIALNQVSEDRSEGTSSGRPSRTTSNRKRGQTKDGSIGAGSSDLRKKAMKNASNSAPIFSERASARRNELNKIKEHSLRSSRTRSPTDESAIGGPQTLQIKEVDHILSNSKSSPSYPEFITSSVRDETTFVKDKGSEDLKAFRLSTRSNTNSTLFSLNDYPKTQPKTNESSTKSTCQSKRLPSIQIQSNHSPLSSPGLIKSHENPFRKLQHCRCSFFTNNSYYCFFRLLHILYTRFKTLKLASLEMSSMPQSQTSAISPLEHQIRTNNLKPRFDYNPTESSSSSSSPEFTAYEKLLVTVQNFNSNLIDQNGFEDECRSLFGIKGYLVITIDKVCQALVKVLSKLSYDESSKEIFRLFENYKQLNQDESQKNNQGLTDFQKLGYRKSIEALISGNESKLYRIEWSPTNQVIKIQLLGGDEINPEDFDSMEKAWSDYIESFKDMTAERTNGLEDVKIKPPFLQRNLMLIKTCKNNQENSFDRNNFYVKIGLGIKICMRSYKIFFKSNTNEFLIRKKRTIKNPSRLNDENQSLKDQNQDEIHQDAVDKDVDVVEDQRMKKFNKWIKTKQAKSSVI
ncbi:hypothetical protein O181_029280 [Austropuccinia psidii MF-1]|uniref:Histone deacetylase interacting domain-containing protein n=1 Tax=Austropuccinia psidii MF-1 TaxID=1389203 RepID=A0A9Q3H516_9BASI|nr:hypothetical protein [Austropuccinia psidii MF-1]